MGRITTRRQVRRLNRSADSEDAPVITLSAAGDVLAVEEPLELRVNGTSTVLTMRTPGDDVELAHGWLHSEGFILDADDVATARYCAGAVVDDELGHSANTYNVLDVQLRTTPPSGRSHPFLANSSCGVCGTASIDDLSRRSRFDITADQTTVDAGWLLQAVDQLAERQRVFHRTGSVHGAGLFSAAGALMAAREDVGRHNAVDKVIGWSLMKNLLPLRGCTLVVTSRASFEIVQKAELAGIPAVAAVSGATSLAVDAARAAGITLVGFLRHDRAVVYSHPSRIIGPFSPAAPHPIHGRNP